MPISMWFCPSCCRPVELDHFAKTVCGEIVHEDYASAVLADDREHEFSGKVAVGSSIGCPRKAAISRTESLIINPLDYNSLMTGKAWHSMMQERSERSESCEVEVTGKILGLAVTGRIDRVRVASDGIVIEDWKHHGDWAMRYLKDESMVRSEAAVQVSLYAELYAQQVGIRPVRGKVWHHSTGGGFLPRDVKLWTLEECLSFRPYNGEFCVADLILQVQGGIEGDWRNLPPSGKSQMFGKSGKTACDYCSSQTVCFTAANGAPF